MHEKKIPWCSFFLAAVSAQFAVMLQGKTVEYTAKEGILAAGICGAVVWLLLLALSTPNAPGILAGRGGIGGALWLSIILVGTVCAAFCLVWKLISFSLREYTVNPFLFAALIAALLLMRPSFSVLSKSAYALLLIFAIALLCAAVGLFGQMHWYELSPSAPRQAGILSALSQVLCFIPEYLAMPLYTEKNKMYAVPLWIFVLQAVSLMGAELIFGFTGSVGRMPDIEMIRAWGIGSFSRIDALLYGVWLVLAVYRLLLLEAIIGKTFRLLKFTCGRRRKSCET